MVNYGNIHYDIISSTSLMARFYRPFSNTLPLRSLLSTFNRPFSNTCIAGKHRFLG